MTEAARLRIIDEWRRHKEEKVSQAAARREGRLANVSRHYHDQWEEILKRKQATQERQEREQQERVNSVNARRSALPPVRTGAVSVPPGDTEQMQRAIKHSNEVHARLEAWQAAAAQKCAAATQQRSDLMRDVIRRQREHSERVEAARGAALQQRKQRQDTVNSQVEQRQRLADRRCEDRALAQERRVAAIKEENHARIARVLEQRDKVQLKQLAMQLRIASA